MIKSYKLTAKSAKGFSLVELMIVVAIMSILAAIAVPGYLNVKLKARETEARTNLAAIRTCENSYKAEHSEYLPCTASPDDIPSAETIEWKDNGGFETIGFRPVLRVRYQYAVTVGNPATTFIATATGNLDGDGDNAILQVTDISGVTKLSEPNIY